MRKKIIAGNWKMNKTLQESLEFINSIKNDINRNDVEVIICPNVLAIKEVSNLLCDTNIKVGAQNAYFMDNGAYTGETSVPMLEDIGTNYCIIGHSERRNLFGETDEIVNKKLIRILDSSILPIVCVGENYEQRKSGKYFEVIENQIINSLANVSSDKMPKVIIAYEPIWAIGTGETASADQAEEIIKYIRELIANIYFKDIADRISILYGGSVNTSNVSELLSMPDIDGALVGGASLKNDFAKLVNYDII